MARTRKTKKQKRQEKRERKEKPAEKKGERGTYVLPLKENAELEKYYKGQGFIPEEQWNTFMETLRKPLPSTFRVTGFRSAAKDLQRIIKSDYMSSLFGEEFVREEGNEVLKNLTWYPDGLAWQLDLDRKMLRKHECLSKLHTFLVQETASGSISRQEAVSMLPPLLLDVKPHHKVLDMCAAPGSKTAQIVELLHADGSTLVPDGCVIANDMDNKRCYLMVHQIGRLNSPNCVIVNHNAANMPNFRTVVDGKEEWLQFDRVLADVPCSGDGTIRKNPDIWKKWHPNSAHYLHSIQHRILKRGLELLAVGGRLVYSTCSLNPIEDEAIVLSMLKLCEGSVSLVDVSNQLPGLKTLPGLSKWKVMTKTGEWYSDFAEVPAKCHSFIHPHMFPPLTEEEQQKYALHRCHRLLPHHQNTGGFFVAVMEKTAVLPWAKPRSVVPQEVGNNEKSLTTVNSKTDADNAIETVAANLPDSSVEAEALNGEGGAAVDEFNDIDDKADLFSDERVYDVGQDGDADSTSAANGGQRKRPMSGPDGNPQSSKRSRFQGHREDPFVFLSDNDPIWPPIKEYYGADEFPVNQLMVRSAEGKKRNLYFVSKSVRQLVEQNTDRIKFVNLGVKILSRSESASVPCDFRLVQDGIEYLHEYMLKRVVKACGEDIVTLLTQENPYQSRMTNATAKQLKDIGKNAAIGSQSEGSCVFVCDANPDSSQGPHSQVVVAGWRGRTTCRSFLAKMDRAHVIRLFGHELKCKEDIMAEKAEKRLAKEGASDTMEQNTVDSASEQQNAETELDDHDAADGAETVSIAE